MTLKSAKTIADGIAVRRAGERTLPLVQKYVDDIVTVEEEEIANAILLLLEREKTLAEGAGAAAIAAVLNRKLPLQGKKDRGPGLWRQHRCHAALAHHRTRPGERRAPGPPARSPAGLSGRSAPLTGILADHRANIVETAYDRAYYGVNLGDTAIDITMETRGPRSHCRTTGSTGCRGLYPRTNPVIDSAGIRITTACGSSGETHFAIL